MVTRTGISREGRQRLEATLSSPALTSKDSVYRMVVNQLSLSSHSSSMTSSHTGEDGHVTNNAVAQDLSAKLWDLLELLRSASGEENQNLKLATEEEASEQGWKLKHDTGQLRVMYREGPEGTPFHTLLAEGFVYSPVTSAVCLAWEAPSYKLWWPQMSIPTFKVMESRWVKRGHMGGDLSFIRVKVPWPLAAREVLMHAFDLEYFDEDLIIVLLHSAPDTLAIEEVNQRPSDVPGVRMQLAGGFALQKVSADESYFRTVVNLDIKLDFVPPWLINFLSRQLTGLGFKLYQNTLTSISNNESSSEHFKKLLETEPMYARIKAGLQSKKAQNCEESRHKNEVEIESKGGHATQENAYDMEESILTNSCSRLVGEVASVHATVENHDSNKLSDDAGKQSPPRTGRSSTGNTPHYASGLDPEVEKALHMLDKMISFVHTYKARTSTSATQTENRATGPSNAPFLVHVDSQPTVVVDHVDGHSPINSTQRPEKAVPCTQMIDASEERTIHTKNSLTLKAKGPKLKPCLACFRSSYSCCS